MSKLLALPWKNQLKDLQLSKLDDKIDINLFVEFIKVSNLLEDYLTMLFLEIPWQSACNDETLV